MVESSKWLATAASIWIQCSCGASYAFGIYSSVLKSSQGYDQSTLDTVSVFKDIGANAGVLSGLLYSAVSAKRPWLVHLAGAVQCFVGYFLLWLSVTGAIHRPPVPANFPDYGGTIVGIMKGFLGLSGAILIQVYQTLFKGNPSTFLLMLALLPTTVSLVLMFLVKINPSSTSNDKKHLNGFSLTALVNAAYLMFLIIVENIFPFPLWAHIITCTILLLSLSSPLKIAIGAQREESLRSSETVVSTTRTPLAIHPESSEVERFLPSEDTIMCHEDAPLAPSQRVLQIGDEMNLLQALCTIDFWLLFIAIICGMGSGLATINNISQIGDSLNYRTVEVSSLVSLWSMWNFLGRFGAGYVSDLYLHRKGWGRPLFMALTQLTMTAGHLIIASDFPGNLYVGSVLVGICYGAQWSLMPTITSEIFGLLHMGTIFNTIAAANPVGSYILSVRVYGYIFDKEALGEGNSCYGTHCFRLSFLIFASVSLFGSLVSMVLFIRTRRFYTLVIFKRLKHLAEE